MNLLEAFDRWSLRQERKKKGNYVITVIFDLRKKWYDNIYCWNSH